MDNNRENKPMVYKANSLIEARYELSAMEQKIILYAASKLNHKFEEDFIKVEIKVTDFFKMAGSTDSKNHEYIKEIAKGLMSKQLEVKKADGGWTRIQWVVITDYLPNEGIITFEFHPQMAKFLLKLEQHYRGYPLLQVMQLQSKYSIRLYELLIQWSHTNHKSLTIEIDDLRGKLGVPKDTYKRFDSFENTVIMKSVAELNNESNINVNYEKIKKGRKINEIKFKFTMKPDTNSEELQGLKALQEDGLANHIMDIKELFNDKELAFNDLELDKAFELVFKRLEKIVALNDCLQDAVYRYMLYYYKYTLDKAHRGAYNYYFKALKEDYSNLTGILKLTKDPNVIKYGDL